MILYFKICNSPKDVTDFVNLRKFKKENIESIVPSTDDAGNRVLIVFYWSNDDWWQKG